MKRNGARDVPKSLQCNSETFPNSVGPSPQQQLFPTLPPTSAAQGVPRVCSALGRTCLGPAGGDAEPWKEMCPQGLAGWASPSPHILPVWKQMEGPVKNLEVGGAGVGLLGE